VRKAIALLHAENLVFGDLRTPNILIDNDVKLIDYDWCGVHQVDKYPFIIGDAIEWASGVGPLAVMHKDHDLYMLQRLEANIRAGAHPGFW
jgi:serine/threonine protein kinase